MKPIITIVFLIFTLANTIYSQSSISKDGQIIIDMKYRGGTLSKSDPQCGHVISSNEFYIPKSVEGNAQKFLEAVEEINPEVILYRGLGFGTAGDILIDYDGNKINAVYNDINMDGKLQKNEVLKKLPRPYLDNLNFEGSDSEGSIFITPDFEIKKTNGQRLPCKYFIKIAFSKKNPIPSIQWTPAGYFYSKCKIKNNKYTLFVLPVDGSYTTFIWSRYLVVPENKSVRYKFSKQLTSEIKIAENLYKVDFLGFSKDGLLLKVMLTENVKPLADFKVNFIGREKIKYRVSDITFLSEDKKTYKVKSSDQNKKIPVGKYTILDAYINYGKKTVYEYGCLVIGSNQICIEPGKVNVINLGKPKIVLSENSYDLRKGEKPQEITSETITLGSSSIAKVSYIGLAGESYESFKNYLNDKFRSVLTVSDSSGKELSKETISIYGRADLDDTPFCMDIEWVAKKIGDYNFMISTETGPFMGVIKGGYNVKVVKPLPRPRKNNFMKRALRFIFIMLR